MKRAMLLLGLMLVAVPLAFGVPLCTDVLGTNVLADDFTCTLGGLTFQNFSASVGDAAITLNAGFGSHETGYSNGVVNLYFNTNFDNYLLPFDVTFVYEVVGTVTGVDGWLGGEGNRNIHERVCLTDDCSDPGDPLGTLVLDETHVTGAISVAPPEDFWVNKDISMAVGSGLSEFAQSYDTVPEPLAMSLVGSGLLALGLLRRRRRS
jgi:hypothetical protein